MLRRSWAEVDLGRIANNYDIYKAGLGDGMQVMAVVKADAYGHGDITVARRLAALGCENFAVSNIDEAVRLREAGIKGQLLILGYTPVAAADILVKYGITQALLSEEYAEHLKGRGVTAQFAIDTGMNRIGLNADDPEECCRIIHSYAGDFRLTGIFTHLCVADTPSEEAFTKGQISKFKEVAEGITDLNLAYIHCMNSAGGLWQPPYGRLARLGIILYGLKPDFANTLPEGILPAMTWKAAVSMVKEVHPGESVGYGRSFTADREMRVATVSAGYADGYSRRLSNKGRVLIRGKEAPVIGRVCMDQFMIDVTGIPDASFEDEVCLLWDGYNADDMARDTGTIGYEVVCGISKRVPREYING